MNNIVNKGKLPLPAPGRGPGGLGIFTPLILLITILALALSHWLSGQPRTALTVRASVTSADGSPVPAAGVRFDVLTRSARAVIDSMCRIEIVRPPDGIVRALEDQNREMFLRGAIERQGFVLSRTVQQMLGNVVQVRRMYLDHLKRFPRYDILLDAVRRIHGPLVAIDEQPIQSAALPALLKREAVLFDPAREELYSEDGPPPLTAQTYEMYYEWLRAVEAYDQGYHRDLVERAIVAAAVLRDAAVVSAETDSLGQAIFPAVHLGAYWISGHFPQDLYALSRAHRVLIARRRANLPPVSQITTWDHPITLTVMSPDVALTESDAIPMEINLPR